MAHELRTAIDAVVQAQRLVEEALKLDHKLTQIYGKWQLQDGEYVWRDMESLHFASDDRLVRRRVALRDAIARLEEVANAATR